MPESYWRIPDLATDKTPLVVMREQAAALTKQTNGLLRGEVQTFAADNFLHITLSIVVPALDNYSVQLLTYQQPIQMYPGTLRLLIGERRAIVRSLAQFNQLLKIFLASDVVKRAVSSLLVQATSSKQV
jgi:hypothetical protein